MPNAVIAHARDGQFDLHGLKQEAREWPGLEGMDLVRWSLQASASPGTKRHGRGKKGLAANRARVQRRRHRLRHQAQHLRLLARWLQGHGGAGDHMRQRILRLMP